MARDLVNESLLGIDRHLAVLRMDTPMLIGGTDGLQYDALVATIQRQGDEGACCERPNEKLVGARSGVVAAAFRRLVGAPRVATVGERDLEPPAEIGKDSSHVAFCRSV